MIGKKSSLEIAGGIVLIFLGILFLIGLGMDPEDLATDAVFVGFGALLIRNAYKSKRESIQNPVRRRSSSGGQSKDRKRKAR